MLNKKYLPSVIVLYINYFLHGIGCSILGQALIKESLAASWNVEVMAITAISAALGLERLIALPFAGPLSDKLGRKISVIIGGASYAVYVIGLACAYNAGGGAGYKIAYICAIVGGIANSFLDTGIYPAVAEIINKAPSVATMGIKFFIAISQMLLPFFLGATVVTTATGATSYNRLFYIVGILYIVMMALIIFLPMPDSDNKAAAEKKTGLIESLKSTKFSAGSIAMILIYPVICLATLIAVLLVPGEGMMKIGAFLIGWAGAGGLLQIATSVCNMLFPKIKGTVTALVMIASSLCNYTILTAAAQMSASGVMMMNIVLTAVGVLLGLFVNKNYAKMLENAEN